MTAAQRGRLAEELAAATLRAGGAVLLARNYRAAVGEIDLIAADGDCIAFVEVRARRAGGMVSPVETINAAKRKKIILTAYDYLEHYPSPLQPRFDVFLVETAGEDSAHWTWDYLPGAFDVGELF